MATKLTLADVLFRLGYENEREFLSHLDLIYNQAANRSKSGGRKSGAAFGAGFKDNFQDVFLGNIFARLFEDAVLAVRNFSEEVQARFKEINNENVLIRQVFGSTEFSVRAWANTVNEALGQSSQEVAATAATFQNFVLPMGFARDEALKLTKDTINLAGALSLLDTKGRTTAEVVDILSKTYIGEREHLKSLGIAIYEADVQQRLLEKGQKKLTGQALQQAKAIATYELVQRKATNALIVWGDGLNEVEAKLRSNKARIAEVRDELATRLAPAVLETRNLALEALAGTLEWINNILRTMTNPDGSLEAYRRNTLNAADASRELESATGEEGLRATLDAYSKTLSGPALTGLQGFIDTTLAAIIAQEGLAGASVAAARAVATAYATQNQTTLEQLDKQADNLRKQIAAQERLIDRPPPNLTQETYDAMAGALVGLNQELSNVQDQQDALLNQNNNLVDSFLDADAGIISYSDAVKRAIGSIYGAAEKLRTKADDTVFPSDEDINKSKEKSKKWADPVLEWIDKVSKYFDLLGEKRDADRINNQTYVNETEALIARLQNQLLYIENETTAGRIDPAFAVVYANSILSLIKQMTTEVNNLRDAAFTANLNRASAIQREFERELNLSQNNADSVQQFKDALYDQAVIRGNWIAEIDRQNQNMIDSVKEEREKDAEAIDKVMSEGYTAEQDRWKSYYDGWVARNELINGAIEQIVAENDANVAAVEDARTQAGLDFDEQQRELYEYERDSWQTFYDGWVMRVEAINQIVEDYVAGNDANIDARVNAVEDLMRQQFQFEQETWQSFYDAQENRRTMIQIEIDRIIAENDAFVEFINNLKAGLKPKVDLSTIFGSETPNSDNTDPFGLEAERKALEDELTSFFVGIPTTIAIGIKNGDVGAALESTLGSAADFFITKLVEGIVTDVARSLASALVTQSVTGVGTAGASVATAINPAFLIAAIAGVGLLSILSSLKTERPTRNPDTFLNDGSGGGASSGGAATVNQVANVTINISPGLELNDPLLLALVRRTARETTRDLLVELGIRGEN